MKNFITILFISATLFACKKDVLDLDPLSEIGSNEFYSNDAELEQATLAIYDGLQNIPLREFTITEMRSDNSKTSNSEGDFAELESYNIQPTNLQVGNYWTVNYNVIFRCNKVLENLDVVSSPDLRAKLEGEAKFSRALAHFNLVRAYGDIPIADRVIGIADEDKFDRDPVAAVYNFIIEDLAAAVSFLPTKDNATFGRATKGAAQGILAKVYLNTGNYSGAESLCETIITSGDYSLEADYEDVFYTEGNDEILFAIPYINDDLNESQDFSREMTNNGRASGLNFITTDFLINLDPNDTERLPVLQNQVATEEVGKFISNSSSILFSGNDWIVLRLADVYLMHVEAKIAGMAATQNIDAINSYNNVRARVGLDQVATDGSGEITLAMLLNERRYELAFENHRFYDLIRTGQAQNILSAFAISEGYTFNSTDMLLPLPQGEINVSNGKLIQNPGY